MNRLLKTLVAMILIVASASCFATQSQMKETLAQMIHQLQAMKPLITKAAQEQSKNPRVKFHFDRFQDSQGHWHNGLRQDIEAIQKALIRAVNRETIEPRHYESIRDDFIDAEED